MAAKNRPKTGPSTTRFEGSTSMRASQTAAEQAASRRGLDRAVVEGQLAKLGKAGEREIDRYTGKVIPKHVQP